eukprot:SAG31_NODE_7277_length_1736_cov_2.010996_1_plen_287_part_10
MPLGPVRNKCLTACFVLLAYHVSLLLLVAFPTNLRSYGHRAASSTESFGKAKHRHAVLLRASEHLDDLWCTRYEPLAGHEVCGNQDAVTGRLTHWLAAMKARAKEDLGEAAATDSTLTTGKRCKKSAGRRCVSDSSESEDSDEDFQQPSSTKNINGQRNRGGLTFAESQEAKWLKPSDHNVLVITGPVGCGKSAAVRAVARELGYSVIESNASDKRSGKAVLGMFGDGAQSHGLNLWGSDQDARSSEGLSGVGSKKRKKQSSGNKDGGKKNAVAKGSASTKGNAKNG